MSKDKLTDAIGNIGDDLIMEAKKSRTAIIVWRRIAAVAACMAVLVGVFYLAFPKGEDESNTPILQNTTTLVTAPTTRPTTAPTTRPQPTTTAKPTTPTTVQNPIPSSSTVMPSTGNNQPAIPILVITNRDHYNQLFFAAGDQSEFIRHQDFIRTFGNRDELKEFVDTLQQLPLPQMNGAICSMLEYIPDYQMLNITLQAADNVVYSFTFQLDAARATEIIDGFADRNMLCEQEWTVAGSETFKSVTEFKQHSTIFPDNYGCWVEINGWLANFTCNGLTGNVSLDTILA